MMKKYKKYMTVLMAAAMLAPTPILAAQDADQDSMLIAEQAEKINEYTVKLVDSTAADFKTRESIVVKPNGTGDISKEAYIAAIPAGYYFVEQPKDLTAGQFKELTAYETDQKKMFELNIEIRPIAEGTGTRDFDTTVPIFVNYDSGKNVKFNSWDAAAKGDKITATTINAAIEGADGSISYATKDSLGMKDLTPIWWGSHDNVIGYKGSVKAVANFETMYRLYNKNSGEHFYTADAAEKNALIDFGWEYEGEAWNAPVKSDTPVYRLYNENAGDHHYTTDKNEKDTLVNLGWKDEEIGWYSASKNGQPLYRLYNPNATGAGAHHYTTDANERDTLVKIGWSDEGTGWYGLY